MVYNILHRTHKEVKPVANGKYRVPDDRSFEIFRHNLKSLMDSRGLNMKELGIALDMNTTSISRYFTERNPDLISIWRIADYFDVTIDWLLGRTTSRFDALPVKQQRIANLYSVSSEYDREVINALLKKYDV
jgi:transcriptional regulator with XRE-family HTH domain